MNTHLLHPNPQTLSYPVVRTGLPVGSLVSSLTAEVLSRGELFQSSRAESLDSTGYDCFTVSLGTWMEDYQLLLDVGVFPYTESSSYHQACITLQRGGVSTILFNRGLPDSTKEKTVLWARKKVERWALDMDWMMSLGYNIVEPVHFEARNYLLFRRLSSGNVYMSMSNNFVDMTLRYLDERFVPIPVTSGLHMKEEFPFECLRKGVVEYEKELYTVEESPYMLETLKRALIEGVEE